MKKKHEISLPFFQMSLTWNKRPIRKRDFREIQNFFTKRYETLFFVKISSFTVT